MDSCCCSLNKYIIWAANFAVFALACASLGVGIYALVDGEGLSDFLDALDIDEDLNIIYLASIFIIVVASFVLLITFLGCCGALKVGMERVVSHTVLLGYKMGNMFCELAVGGIHAT